MYSTKKRRISILQSEEDYNKDLQHAVKITRVIFEIIGIWPVPEGANTFYRIRQKIQNIICYFLLLNIIVPGFLRLFLKEKRINIRIKILGSLISAMLSFLKYSILLRKRNGFRTALSQMNDDWNNVTNNEDQKMMRTYVNLGRRLIISSAAFIYCSGVTFRTVLPLSKGRMLLPNNVTVRALTCPSYYIIFDEQITPMYEIVFTLQLFAGLIGYSVLCAPCGMAAFFVLHICSQLRILISHIHGITKGDDFSEKLIQKRFEKTVQLHIKINKFFKKIQGIMEGICLADMVGCTLIFCLAGYFVVMDWEQNDATTIVTYFMILICFELNVFIWCYIGQLLENETMEVYQSVKLIDWYQLPLKQSQYLLIIIAMSSNPAKLTANKMMNMSLATFADVLKASVVYLNFFRKVV